MYKKIYLPIAILYLSIQMNASAQHFPDAFKMKDKAQRKAMIETMKEFRNTGSKQGVIYKYGKMKDDMWNETSSEWDSVSSIFYTYNPAGDILTSTLVINGTPSTKSIYTYNNGNQVSELVNQVYDGTGWRNTLQKFYLYDNDGNTTEVTERLWNINISQWTNHKRETNLYNQYKHEVLYTLELFKDNSWELNSGFEIDIEYDTNGFPLGATHVNFNYAEQRWDAISRVIYVNHPNGNPKHVIHQSFMNSDWVNVFKELNTMNANGEIDSMTSFMFNVNTNSWDSLERMVDIEWNNWTGSTSTSQLKSYTNQMWNTGEFRNFVRFNMELIDNNGSRVYNYETHDGVVWEPLDRTSVFYNDKRDYLGVHYEEWIDDKYITLDHIVYDLTYNQQGILIENIMNVFNGVNGLRKSRRITYSDFSTYSTGFDFSNKKSLNIYPNPIASNGDVFIEIPSEGIVNIELYNIYGTKQKVLVSAEKLSKGIHQFKLNDCASGVYILKGESNGSSYSNKIIIK